MLLWRYLPRPVSGSDNQDTNRESVHTALIKIVGSSSIKQRVAMMLLVNEGVESTPYLRRPESDWSDWARRHRASFCDENSANASGRRSVVNSTAMVPSLISIAVITTTTINP